MKKLMQLISDDHFDVLSLPKDKHKQSTLTSTQNWATFCTKEGAINNLKKAELNKEINTADVFDDYR